MCATLGWPLIFENKGNGLKCGSYLICDGAMRRLDCPGLRSLYGNFEASFIAFEEEADMDTMVNTSQAGEKRKLEVEIGEPQGKLAAVNNFSSNECSR